MAVNEDLDASKSAANSSLPPQVNNALAFDEEAKLVYGVILSLRNMMKKLSKRCVNPSNLGLNNLIYFSSRDENFTAYRTSTYKMHLYETPTLYKFVLLTDPKADSSPTSPAPVRLILRQIYAGPFLEFVVRNPLAPMDSRTQGIDNEYFRASVDRLVRGMSIFQ